MDYGVIFDMDGVLVDSGPAHAESWRVLAGRHGIDISDEEFKRTFGKTSRDIVRIIFGDALSEEQVREYDDEKEAAYRDLVRGAVPLTPGVREMLEQLTEAGLALAVATSGPGENVELVLSEGDLHKFFKTVVTAFDVQNGKPAPDCFLIAAERAGLLAHRCVVVEDAPVGIQAALAAGMKAIGFVGTHPASRLEAAGAHAIVRQLSAITPEAVLALVESA